VIDDIIKILMARGDVAIIEVHEDRVIWGNSTHEGVVLMTSRGLWRVLGDPIGQRDRNASAKFKFSLPELGDRWINSAIDAMLMHED